MLVTGMDEGVVVMYVSGSAQASQSRRSLHAGESLAKQMFCRWSETRTQKSMLARLKCLAAAKEGVSQ
jgi:hypothetical protein